MSIIVSVPEDILTSDSQDSARRVLELVAIEGFKAGQLSISQLRRILGFSSRLQVHEFLASHDIPWVDYDEEELNREVEDFERLVKR